MRVSIATLVLITLFVTSSSYPRFQKLIPNGGQVIDSCSGDGTIWEGVGHEDKRGGGPLNQFGIDFSLAGLVF